jgi:hypothetical protein
MQHICQSPFCQSLCAVSTALVCIVTPATAQHFDIGVRVSDGALQTDSLGTKGATPARVFPATFGDTGVARFTSNPGFDALPGTFSAGTRLGFNALDGLRRFTGSAVEPVTTERLEVKFLTLVTLVGSDAVNGFDLAVQSNGGYHRHFNFTLKAEGGQLPASGIYVATFELYTNDGVTLPSDPFFIVFNDGRSSSEHDEAIAWVEANLVTTPTNCPADLDDDQDVGAADLAQLLASWATASADLDGDGDTGAADLSMLLAAWGACE